MNDEGGDLVLDKGRQTLAPHHLGVMGQVETVEAISYEKGIKFKLSGTEFYFTISLTLLVMLCSKLHCQKSLISFSFQIRPD